MINLIFGLLFIFSSKINFQVSADFSEENEKFLINIFSDYKEIKKYYIEKVTENNDFILVKGDYIFFNAKKFSIDYNYYLRKLVYEEE